MAAPTDRQYRQAAHRLYVEEGSVEVDDFASVSRFAEGLGAYVQAWVWVDSEEAEGELK